jgi:hypothetical protein
MKKRQLAQKKPIKVSRKSVKAPKGNPTLFVSHNFSDVEDSKKAFEIISSIFIRAGKNAAAEAKAAGLSQIFVRNNQLIRVSGDGKETVVKTSPDKAKSFYVKYKPSTVLHARK